MNDTFGMVVALSESITTYLYQTFRVKGVRSSQSSRGYALREDHTVDITKAAKGYFRTGQITETQILDMTPE